VRRCGFVRRVGGWRTWLSADDGFRDPFAFRHTDRFHHELGVSLTLLDFLHVDYTRRLDRADRRWGINFSKSF
jgi:hypothetical protein